MDHNKRAEMEHELQLIQAFNKQKKVVNDLKDHVALLKKEFLDRDSLSLLGDILKAESELEGSISELDRLEKQVIPLLPGSEHWVEWLPEEGADQSSVEEHLRKLMINLEDVDERDLDKMIGAFRSIGKTVEILDHMKKEELLKPLKDEIRRTLKEACMIGANVVYCGCSDYGGGFRAVKMTANVDSNEHVGKQFWGCPFWISEDEPGCGFHEEIKDDSV